MEIDSTTAEELARRNLGGNWSARSFGAGRFSHTFLLRGVEEKDEDRDEMILRVGPPDDLLQLFYEYRMMRQEPEIHRLVREQSSIPIPEIAAHDFSRTIIDRDYLFMPRLPGKPLSEAPLSRKAAEQAHYEWGRYIAQLHRITHPNGKYGYAGAHEPMNPASTWREAFLEMYRLELEDIRRAGVYRAEDYSFALGLLEEHADIFSNIVLPVLCHGDIWVTNLMVESDGNVTGVIDFDRACWGDPEWDLAIADYCGVTTEAFIRGYGGDPREAEDADREAVRLRRLFYLLYEHQKYIIISLSARRNDPAGARRYAEQSLSMMKKA